MEVQFEAAGLGWVWCLWFTHRSNSAFMVSHNSDLGVQLALYCFFIFSLHSLFHLPAQTNIKETWKWVICFWRRATFFSFNIFLPHQTIRKMNVGCGLNVVSLKWWMWTLMWSSADYADLYDLILWAQGSLIMLIQLILTWQLRRVPASVWFKPALV